jgi:geranylgeranylglycerol-phosphate geranylgeranyltransferase
MKKITGFYKLTRFELPFSAGICVIMGQLLALGTFASARNTLFGFLSVFMISASILVLNDYFDVETDRINAPNRPIPAGIVSKTEALLFTIALIVVGVILSFHLGIVPFIGVIVLLIIGNLYNRKFKKTGLLGNLMVSFSVGTTFIYGAISIGSPFNKAAWFFGVVAALIDLGEEIAADAMDIQGDTLIDSKSLAIVYGKSTAIKISSGIFLLVILLTSVPFILSWFKTIYLIPIAIMDAAIAYSTFRLMKSRGQEGRRYIRLLYLGATLGLVIFIVISIFIS